MRKATTRRLDHVETAILSSPIPSEVLKPAFERFRNEGELPDNRYVTRAVLRQCRTGLDASQEGGMDEAALIRHMIHFDRPKDEVMDGLYAEAVADNTVVRDIAHQALKLLHDCGFDVTEPVFAKNREQFDLPDFGSAGLWVFGFPDILVRPPYEERARRLIDRYAELRERVPQGNRRWFDNLAVAVMDFQDRGVLPEDALVLDCVLADLELCELIRNVRGASNPELMAALDEVAKASGEERGRALQRVVAIMFPG